nr:teicoplanin resistance protein VanZ [Paracoccus saliphilus]
MQLAQRQIERRERMSTQSKLVIGLSLLMATAIAVLTLSPISAPPVGTVAQSDKIYHAVAFAGLVLPIAFFRPRWLILATPVYAAFGGLIEIVQPLAGRDCNLGDWSADLIGLCLGVAVGRTAATVVPFGGQSSRWSAGGGRLP